MAARSSKRLIDRTKLNQVIGKSINQINNLREIEWPFNFLAKMNVLCVLIPLFIRPQQPEDKYSCEKKFVLQILHSKEIESAKNI